MLSEETSSAAKAAAAAAAADDFSLDDDLLAATAKELAARLGRDKAQVSRVLNGSVPTITLETLALFLDGLDHQLIIDCRAAEDVPLSHSAAPRTEPDAGSVAHLEDKRARSA